MHRRIAVWTAVLLMLAALFAVPSLAEDNGYVIRNYSFNATLTEQNVMEVTEVIDVEFLERSHGIYRDIPIKYKVEPAVTGHDEWLGYIAEVKNLEVEGAPFDTEHNGDNLSIRIGSADEYVEGMKTYAIRYSYIMPDDRIPEFDMLYYSVLGTSWTTRIDRFDFEIQLEKPLDSESLQGLTVKSGKEGAGGNSLKVELTAEPACISGSAQNIPAEQGITLFCRLPQGFFSATKSGSDSSSTFAMAGAGGLGIIGLFLALFRKRPDIHVERTGDVPEDLDSAYAGRLTSSASDEKQVLSLIMYWADRKYLQMTTGEDGFLTLECLQDLPNSAPLYQQILWDTLFTRARKQVRLKGQSPALALGVEKAQEKLDKRVQKKGRISSLLLLAALCLATAILFHLGAFRFEPNIAHSLVVCGVLPLLLGVFARLYAGSQKGRIVWGVATAAMLCICINNMLVKPFLADQSSLYFSRWILVGAGALMIAFALLNPRMMYLSEDLARDKATSEALKDYLQHAPEEELARRVQSDPGYAYRILPYAIAMGLAEDWAAYFKDVMIPAVSWYVDTGCDMPDYMLMYIVRRMEQQFYRPYRNSNRKLIKKREEERAERERQARESGSSGGGGFSSSSGSSGGGGGGGGGGRW